LSSQATNPARNPNAYSPFGGTRAIYQYTHSRGLYKAGTLQLSKPGWARRGCPRGRTTDEGA